MGEKGRIWVRERGKLVLTVITMILVGDSNISLIFLWIKQLLGAVGV